MKNSTYIQVIAPGTQVSLRLGMCVRMTAIGGAIGSFRVGHDGDVVGCVDVVDNGGLFFRCFLTVIPAANL